MILVKAWTQCMTLKTVQNLGNCTLGQKWNMLSHL